MSIKINSSSQYTFKLVMIALFGLVSLVNLAHAQSPVNNYKVLQSTFHDSQTMYSAIVGYFGESNYYLNVTNPIIKYLNFSLTFQSANQFQIKIVDANNTRWEIPNEAPFPHNDPSVTFPINNGLATIQVNHDPFWFKVTRKDTNEVIFDSSVGNFIYSDYYIELSTPIPSPYIYGLGDRGYNFTLGPTGIYTIWNADFNQNVETGLGGHNSYGSHPVYMMKEKSGNWSMNLLRNVNAMDIILMNAEVLTYKITGGILDFNFFLESSPENVITTYHKYLGGWAMPPFWTLGYQQSRWGYNSLEDLSGIIGNFSKYDMPLDVIWSDIDYMYDYIDFTIDEQRFPLEDFNKMLEETGKRWVPIIDAGIGLSEDESYKRGVDMDVYIKAPNGSYVVGYVWPGGTSWVDWFHPNATVYWNDGLQTVYDKVPYSGIWLDMNEISNLVDGEMNFVPNLTDIRNALPYTPGDRPLYTDTIRLDAVHYNGQSDFNTHSIFHIMEGKITYDFLKTKTELPFILSRSNMFGSGKYAAHWTGDNNSSWVMLQLSIPAIMNFNMYGIPLTGSDICGFKKNTSEELCARWMQLGLLYPFSRNHAENDTIHQEPWSFGETLLTTSKIAIDTKYTLLKFYYSLFLNQNGYGTVFRPVFFEFPNDDTLMTPQNLHTDRQFLLGKGLMAAPVVEPGVETVDVYFPADRWFDFFTGEVMHNQYEEGALYNDYPAPLNSTAPLFVRGGFIVQTQNTHKVMRSDDLDNTYSLTVALKETTSDNYEAQGQIVGVTDYSEKNIYERCVQNNCMLDVQATATSSSSKCETQIKFVAQDSEANLDLVDLSSVQVYGCFSDKASQPNVPFILNQAYLNGQLVGKQLQRGASNDVYEVYVGINNEAIQIQSGDVLSIVSEYINYI